MLKRASRKMRYAILLLKMGGPKVFFYQLKRQIYSRAIFIGLERDLDTDLVRVPSRVEYSLRLASEEDMEEAFQKIKMESRQSAYELIKRKRFYESGFHNCYVGRTADAGELCHLHWMISAEEDNLARRYFPTQWPKLKEGECLLENAYTFEKYRGKRMLASAQTRLCEIARSKGYKRVIAYAHPDSVPSLKGAEMAGYRKFEKVSVFKLLFFTKRKYL